MTPGPFFRRKPFTLDPLLILVVCFPFVVTNAQERAVPSSPNKKPIGQIAYDRKLTAKILSPHMPSFADIFVVDADGRNAWQLTSGGLSFSPAWSPDGRQIAFLFSRHQISDNPLDPLASADDHRWPALFVMDADGNNVHKIRSLHLPVVSIGWSPDGKTLAVTAKSAPMERSGTALAKEPGQGRGGIYVLPVTGDGTIRLVIGGGSDPSWSPDGTNIAYSANRDKDGGKSSIFIAKADGSGEIRLTEKKYSARSPAWSPDGKTIAFVSNWKEMDQILLVGTDGSGIRQLTRDKRMTCSRPSWSPDGEQIAAQCKPNRPVAGTSFSSNGYNVFLMSVRDPKGEPTQLTKDGGSNPVFCPQ